VRIASAIMLAVVAALFAFWWGWVRAPAPPAVCEHLVDLTVREAGSAGLDPTTQGRLLEATRERCLQMAHDKLKLRSRLGYAAWAKCIAEAQTVADSGRC
jgi:hypothetical protein